MHFVTALLNSAHNAIYLHTQEPMTFMKAPSCQYPFQSYFKPSEALAYSPTDAETKSPRFIVAESVHGPD